jgi:hypothetical protein
VFRAVGSGTEDVKETRPREMRRTYSTLTRRSPLLVLVHPYSPCPTFAHPAREVQFLKRHDVGERESELGADFTYFSCRHYPTFLHPAHPPQGEAAL